MKKVYLRTRGKDGRKSVKVGTRIAGGGAGDIYTMPDLDGHVLKIYKAGADKDLYALKLEAMLAAVPKVVDVGVSENFPFLAWPIGIAENRNGQFLGFAMPEVDFKNTVSLERMLQTRMREASGLPLFYGFRLLAACNLASIVAELHKIGHHLIDLKPVNCRLHPDKMFISILDCDGFSIKGRSGKRFHAAQFSEEYIAPEASNNRPSELGEEQDLFALAVIIFRLLNNGLHPYQGIIPKGEAAKTIQQMINMNYYAYGVNSGSKILPAKQSIHESFPKELRDLFDKAFNGGRRPKASKWRDILQAYTKTGGLIRCKTKPEVHGYFDEALGCGWCALEGLNRRAPAARKPSASASNQRRPPRGRQPKAAAIPLSGHSKIQERNFFIAAVVSALVLFFIHYGSDDGEKSASSDSPPSKVVKEKKVPGEKQRVPIQKTEKVNRKEVTPFRQKGIIKANTNMRKGPSTDFDKIITIPKGTKVQITGRVASSNWYALELRDSSGKHVVRGYVWGRNLAIEPKQTDRKSKSSQSRLPKNTKTKRGLTVILMNKSGFLTVETVLRKGAGLNFNGIVRILKGTEVKVIGRVKNSNWYRVKIKGYVGFVNSNHIALLD